MEIFQITIGVLVILLGLVLLAIGIKELRDDRSHIDPPVNLINLGFYVLMIVSGVLNILS